MNTANNKRIRGFTLIEVMIAVTILVVALGMMAGFMVENARASFIGEQKNLVNQDIRNLTNELSDNGRAANYFLLYKSFKNTDRDKPGDRVGESNSGDLLVLVYQGPARSLITETRPISAIVGYYRAPSNPDNPKSLRPVRKFELSFNPASTASVESLIPDESTVNSYPVVVELSEGLANSRLFYNFWNKSVMVNGKIIHGNKAKRVTDTYNFTISPRG